MLWRRLGLQINPFTEWNAYYTWHFLFRISLFSKAIERNLLNVKEKILNKFVCLLPSIYDSEVPSQKFWRTSISSLKKKKKLEASFYFILEVRWKVFKETLYHARYTDTFSFKFCRIDKEDIPLDRQPKFNLYSTLWMLNLVCVASGVGHSVKPWITYWVKVSYEQCIKYKRIRENTTE